MNSITSLCCSNFQCQDLKSQLTLDFNYTDYPCTIKVKPIMLFATFQIRVLTSESRQMAQLGFIVPTTLSRDRESDSRQQSCTSSRDLLRTLYRLSNTAAATYDASFEHVSSF